MRNAPGLARLARRASVLVSMAALSSPVFAELITFEIGGDATAASIQGTVDSFRAALGNPNNANEPGTTGGRREINWDGGGATVAAPAGTPFTGFTDPRGATFTTPGSGFLQTPLDDPAFTGINPTYTDTFSFFSPVRIFTPVDSNITDVTFSIPGTAGATPATVGGFGAVFSDVDIAGSTSLELFDDAGALIDAFFVPVGEVDDGSLSFFGFVGDAGEQVARIRITTGSGALGPDDSAEFDAVVMDDFLYAEPVAQQQEVPEPATWLLMLAGVASLGMLGRRPAMRRG